MCLISVVNRKWFIFIVKAEVCSNTLTQRIDTATVKSVAICREVCQGSGRVGSVHSGTCFFLWFLIFRLELSLTL